MLKYLSLVAASGLILSCAAGGSASGGEGGASSDSESGASDAGAASSASSSTGSDDDTASLVLEPDPASIIDETECDNILEVTYRDFDLSHPDFEMAFAGDVVRRQLIKPDLGSDSKPQFLSTTGCPADDATPTSCANWDVTEPEISSEETFNQWYRDVEGVNYRFNRELTLVDQGNGKYLYSSNSFFPIGINEGWGATPPEHINQNFLFTTEIHLAFTYVAQQTFTFYGDDDLWIFVNGKLALDLGGMHSQALGTIDFDAQASYLDITPGKVYRMDVFHAERHTTGSNFQIETTIGCFVPVDIEVF